MMNNRGDCSKRTRQELNCHYESLGKLNTYLRQANEKLVLATFDARALKSDAEAANNLQQKFLAMLAHELRNPLAPIGLASRMLKKIPNQSPELIRIQEIIDRQLSSLTRLLDDLLDAARVESGKISIVPLPIILADVVANAVELASARFIERDQELTIVIPDDEIIIDGDAIRLAQVISNLLINSSKFTQRAGIISVTVRALGDNVEITVADNGAGMAPELLPNIFNLFTQGTVSLERNKGGLGIGLHLVKNIVELHGGSVSATSDGPGRGSVFTVLLPRTDLLVARESTSFSYESDNKNYRILLVEDNRDASDLLSMVLQSEGYLVTVEHDGLAALAEGCKNHFDLLISDIGLPGIDGYELIRRLHDYHNAETPIAISISGYGQVEDKRRALSAGYSCHLVKPVDPDKLLELVRTLPH